jgi:hypothetical protein
MRTGMSITGTIAVLVATAAVAGGCAGGNRAAGCTRVADEGRLLDEYARDPVFDIRPDGARYAFGKQRSVDCVVDPDWPDDPTQTAVDLRMPLPRRAG